MRLWNDRVRYLVIAGVLFGNTALVIAQSSPASSAPVTSAPATSSSAPPSTSPSSSVSTVTTAPPSAQSPGVPQDQSPAPIPLTKGDDSTFILHREVDEVSLHATVIDDKDRLITNLERSAFSVFEDGHPQSITSFRHEDIPVSMAILIDNSGSMREKREKVNQAALNLVRSSNAQDEVFIVNFNDEEFLDQDFTSDIGKLKEALEKYESRGGTALFDAVDGAADHMKKNSRREKRVIFLVTDGEDNASRDTLEQVVQALQQEGGPTVYAIGLLGEEKQRHARRALQLLAQRTGGIAFFPKTLDEVDQISRTVAHDIRNQYSIGYKPSNPKSAGGYRQIRVDARAHGYSKLSVRTKSGYYANPQPVATSGSK